MKLLFIGPKNIYNELVANIPSTVGCKYSHQPVNDNETYDVVFDAVFDERVELPQSFIYPTTNLVIGSSVKRKLSESESILKQHIKASIVGMNLLPTFVSMKTKEISANDDEAMKRFTTVAETFQWFYKNVKDEIGLVTPRVLCMIINEAAHTLEENTATKEDIDRGMELGTGYLQGPLIWCDKIGVNHVVDVLEALHTSTGDERYRISRLLLRMKVSGNTFY